MGGKGAPSAPSYVQPAPYQAPAPYVNPGAATNATQQSPGAYVNPGPYQQAPDPNSVVPQAYTYQQIGAKSVNLDNYLPAWMQLTGSGATNQNPIDPNSAGFQDARNAYYASNVAPLIAQDQANVNTSGADYGSYAGGLIGTDKAQGNLAAYNAGINYSQAMFQDVLNARQNYFGTNVATILGQNQEAINRGLGVSQLQTTQAQNLNNYNLQNSQNQNSFDLGSASLNNQFQLGNQSNTNQYNLGSANLANTYNLDVAQGRNQYSLGASGQQNSFDAGVYGSQVNAYNNNPFNQGLARFLFSPIQ
jgi:hypothetical protein